MIIVREDLQFDSNAVEEKERKKEKKFSQPAHMNVKKNLFTGKKKIINSYVAQVIQVMYNFSQTTTQI